MFRAKPERGRQGTPESEKTLITAAQAILYAIRGISVFIFAPSPSRARVVGEAVAELLQMAGTVVVEVLKSFFYEDSFEKSGKQREKSGKQRNAIPKNPISIVVSTPNLICDENMCRYFGKAPNNIIAIFDDSDSMLESEVLATVASAAMRPNANLRGFILVGDVRETPLEVVSQVDVVRRWKDGKPVKDDPPDRSYLFTRFFQISRDRSRYERLERGESPLEIEK